MIKKILAWIIPKSDLSKNVSTLIAGTGIAQAITFIFSPVLSRIYLPEEFAVFALFTSITAIIGVVAAARFELAIVLPEKDSDAKGLAHTAIKIVVAISLISIIGIYIFDLAGGETITPMFSSWFYLIGLSIFCIGCFAIFNYWSTRMKTFKQNSAARIFMAITTVLVSTITGYYGLSYKGLILGLISGQAAGAFVLYLNFATTSKDISIPDSNEKKALLKEHKDFATINSPHALLDSFQDNGMVFILSYYYMDAIVGFYSFAYRILKAPVGLIGSAFQQVFYQRLSNAYNQGENIQPHIISIYKRLAIIGLPGFTILFIFTPQIFGFIFGENWREAGEIAQILIPWLLLNFIASPVACVTLIFKRQKKAFILTVIDFILRLISLLVGGYLNNYTLGFILMSICSSFMMLYAMWWFYTLAGNKKLII